MNLAEWILVIFLSLALLVFLIVGIIFIVKLTSLLSEIEIMVQTGQSIFNKADGRFNTATSMGQYCRDRSKDCRNRVSSTDRTFSFFTRHPP